MDRRTFLKTLGICLLSRHLGVQAPARAFTRAATPDPSILGAIAGRPHHRSRPALHPTPDIWLSPNDHTILPTVLARFARIQATVGHGNFCLLGFDDGLRIARGYPHVGAFPGRELVFLDKLFNTDARAYGFNGRKLFRSMTEAIDTHGVDKIPGTGNYLYQGSPQKLYNRLSRHLGERFMLTAGVRGIAKQFHLFLQKVAQTRGNLSMASRSLAPPGYSYHGIGDFDVGQVGLGAANFTDRFTRTSVYRELTRLDYVVFRYPRNNRLGVRFEPWHIQTTPNDKEA